MSVSMPPEEVKAGNPSESPSFISRTQQAASSADRASDQAQPLIVSSGVCTVAGAVVGQSNSLSFSLGGPSNSTDDSTPGESKPPPPAGSGGDGVGGSSNSATASSVVSGVGVPQNGGIGGGGSAGGMALQYQFTDGKSVSEGEGLVGGGGSHSSGAERGDGRTAVGSNETDDMDDAEIYIKQYFLGEISLNQIIDLMTRFLASPEDSREHQLCDSLIRTVISECPFISKYPPPQAVMYAELFGLMISQILAAHNKMEFLSRALYFVSEALVSAKSDKIFNFGFVALKQFLGEVSRFPMFIHSLGNSELIRNESKEVADYLESFRQLIPTDFEDRLTIPIEAAATLNAIVGSSVNRSSAAEFINRSLKNVSSPKGSSSQVNPPPHEQPFIAKLNPGATEFRLSDSSTHFGGEQSFGSANGGGLNDTSSAGEGGGSSQSIGCIPPQVPLPPHLSSQTLQSFGLGHIESLMDDPDVTTGMIYPPVSFMDCIGEIFNSITRNNVAQKANELRDLLHPSYIPFLSFYIVKSRAAKELNLHEIYFDLINLLNHPDLFDVVTHTTSQCINVMLKYVDEAQQYSSYRSVLKNLGGWLGTITLGRARPLKLKAMHLKELIFEAYENGRLLAILPLVCQIMLGIKSSKNFMPPNPWTNAIFNLLSEIHELKGLKTNLMFEIEILFKNLGVNLDEYKNCTDLLSKRRHPEKSKSGDFVIKEGVGVGVGSGLGLGLPAQPTQPTQPTQSTQSSQSSQSGGEAAASSFSPPLANPLANDTSLTSAFANPNLLVNNANRWGGGGGWDANPTSLSAYEKTLQNLSKSVVISPSLALFKLQPNFKCIVPIAVDCAIQEVVPVVVARAVSISSMTTRDLVLKDFAFESDPSLVKRAAHLMVSNLAGSLALVTCREPLKASLVQHLRELLQQTGSTNINDEVLIEQVAQTLSSDNIDLCCNIVEQAVVQRAIYAIEMKLSAELKARKRAKEENLRYVDTNYINNNSKWLMHLPDCLRCAPMLDGRPLQVYKQFYNMGSLKRMQEAASKEGMPQIRGGGYFSNVSSPSSSSLGGGVLGAGGVVMNNNSSVVSSFLNPHGGGGASGVLSGGGAVGGIPSSLLLPPPGGISGQSPGVNSMSLPMGGVGVGGGGGIPPSVSAPSRGGGVVASSPYHGVAQEQQGQLPGGNLGGGGGGNQGMGGGGIVRPMMMQSSYATGDGTSGVNTLMMSREESLQAMASGGRGGGRDAGAAGGVAQSIPSYPSVQPGGGGPPSSVARHLGGVASASSPTSSAGAVNSNEWFLHENTHYAPSFIPTQLPVGSELSFIAAKFYMHTCLSQLEGIIYDISVNPPPYVYFSQANQAMSSDGSKTPSIKAFTPTLILLAFLPRDHEIFALFETVAAIISVCEASQFDSLVASFFKQLCTMQLKEAGGIQRQHSPRVVDLSGLYLEFCLTVLSLLLKDHPELTHEFTDWMIVASSLENMAKRTAVTIVTGFMRYRLVNFAEYDIFIANQLAQCFSRASDAICIDSVLSMLKILLEHRAVVPSEFLHTISWLGGISSEVFIGTLKGMNGEFYQPAVAMDEKRWKILAMAASSTLSLGGVGTGAANAAATASVGSGFAGDSSFSQTVGGGRGFSNGELRTTHTGEPMLMTAIELIEDPTIFAKFKNPSEQPKLAEKETKAVYVFFDQCVAMNNSLIMEGNARTQEHRNAQWMDLIKKVTENGILNGEEDGDCFFFVCIKRAIELSSRYLKFEEVAEAADEGDDVLDLMREDRGFTGATSASNPSSFTQAAPPPPERGNPISHGNASTNLNSVTNSGASPSTSPSPFDNASATPPPPTTADTSLPAKGSSKYPPGRMPSLSSSAFPVVSSSSSSSSAQSGKLSSTVTTPPPQPPPPQQQSSRQSSIPGGASSLSSPSSSSSPSPTSPPPTPHPLHLSSAPPPGMEDTLKPSFLIPENSEMLENLQTPPEFLNDMLDPVPLDTFARMVVSMMKIVDSHHNAPNVSLSILQRVLRLICRVVYHESTPWNPAPPKSFNPRPYFRLLLGLIFQINTLEKIGFYGLLAIANHLLVLSPNNVPATAYCYLQLISHRSFLPRLLRQGKGALPFQRLLIEHCVFLQGFLHNMVLPHPVRDLFTGTLKVFLLLLHDFPEFLCDYYISFLDILTPHCIQLRNVITSAFPSNMQLPDPFLRDLKVKLVPEINRKPSILTNYMVRLLSNSLKKEIDEFIHTGRRGVLPMILKKLRLDPREAIVKGCKYSIPMMNSLVLYVGVIANDLNRVKAATLHPASELQAFASSATDGMSSSSSSSVCAPATCCTSSVGEAGGLVDRGLLPPTTSTMMSSSSGAATGGSHIHSSSLLATYGTAATTLAAGSLASGGGPPPPNLPPVSSDAYNSSSHTSWPGYLNGASSSGAATPSSPSPTPHIENSAASGGGGGASTSASAFTSTSTSDDVVWGVAPSSSSSSLSQSDRRGIFAPNNFIIGGTRNLELFLYLVKELDMEGRYMFFSVIMNHLRYPNTHTRYFSFLVLWLFGTCEYEIVKEQITRVLFERLIVHRPHPWGLLITFIELVRNGSFNFWKCAFVNATPEVYNLLKSVTQPCFDMPSGSTHTQQRSNVKNGKGVTLPSPSQDISEAQVASAASAAANLLSSFQS